MSYLGGIETNPFHFPKICIMPYFLLLVLLMTCSSKNSPKTEESSVNTKNEDHIIPDFPNEVDKNFLLGKYDPATHEDFMIIPKAYASREGMLIQKKVWESFRKMHEEAQRAGVALTIVSATRNHDYQKGIWEKKWNAKAAAYKSPLSADDKVAIARDILKFSSMPGTSRHHWGTDIDLNDLEPEYFKKGPGKKVYDWLKKNAGAYGFCQTYTPKSWGREGYEEESWHWSYMPLSDNYLKEYIRQVKLEDICCFAGSEAAVRLDVINIFVKGINPGCSSK